jgi:hypothetical protein
MGRPSTPPLALISSSAIWAAVRPVAPKNDHVPESSAIQPILIGSPFGYAAAGEESRKAKTPIVKKIKNT